ncbi:MAG: hypothetical protein AAGB51_06710 [Planctomycetota bacterium]
MSTAALACLAGAAYAQPADPFDGYDFGEVVEVMERSVTPLQREMDRSFKVFIERMGRAEILLDEGRLDEAVQEASDAIDGVLLARETVLEPMWAGQEMLQEETARARSRLARAVNAAALQSKSSEPDERDVQTEAVLDSIATRIVAEPDELRKRRLTAHYRAVRDIGRIRRIADHLSPDQRKLWLNVLHVLDEAALAHQRVLMGSEVLFSQFEVTSANLKEYLRLMRTVDGASDLLTMVRGLESSGEGMSGFADNMNQLQERLAGFNESVEAALQSQMSGLEVQIDRLSSDTYAGTAGSDGAVIAEDIDAELESRLDRLRAQPSTPIQEGDTP